MATHKKLSFAFWCPNFWLCNVEPSPGVLRGFGAGGLDLSDLRFAPKFQSEKANGGEEAVETPNLQSCAACFFSFFSKLVVSSVKLDIFPNFRGETKKCLKLPHSFSWNVFLVIFFKASACEVCGRMMLY